MTEAEAIKILRNLKTIPLLAKKLTKQKDTPLISYLGKEAEAIEIAINALEEKTTRHPKTLYEQIKTMSVDDLAEYLTAIGALHTKQMCSAFGMDVDDDDLPVAETLARMKEALLSEVEQ